MGIFRRKPKNAIKLCPKCMKASLKQGSNISGFLTPDFYECQNKDCEYSGPFFVEVDLDEIDEEQLRLIKVYQNEQKHDNVNDVNEESNAL